MTFDKFYNFISDVYNLILCSSGFLFLFGVVLAIVCVITMQVTIPKFVENQKIQLNPNSSDKTPDELIDINILQPKLSAAITIEAIFSAISLYLIIKNLKATGLPQYLSS